LSRKDPPQEPEIENGEDVIRAMFSVDGVANAIKASNFDIEEEVRMYIDIARNSLDDNTRLSALQRLNRRVREVADVNGLIVTGSAKMVSHDEQGNILEQTRSESRLLSQVRGLKSLGTGSLASRVLPPTGLAGSAGGPPPRAAE
jgi:hypothetical protein